jgi:transglutaminase-like putative cysteine protease
VSQALDYESQISRSSLFWLLFAQFALILPHIQGLPLWLFGVCLFCGFWRIQIYRGKWPFASGFTRIVMMLGSVIAVSFTYVDKLGLDAAVTYLILTFFLKLLETRRARDMYVTIFLGYFVAATQLLYSQSVLSMIYVVLCYLLLSVSLLALHQRDVSSIGLPIARAGVLLLQGLPVLVVLFLFFPRVDPLWMVPMPSQARSPGLSDSISPGSFGSLANNDTVTFRVSFDGAVPDISRLYWRAAVFENYDGMRWQIAEASERPVKTADWQYAQRAVGYSYSIILEPSEQTWLFAIPLGKALDASIVTTAGFNLRLSKAPQGRFQYRVNSVSYRSLEAELSAETRPRNLALPAEGNPRSRLLGEELARQYGTPRKIAAAAMSRFGQEAYYYTLYPPFFETDPIDGFLFKGRRGYCEHYASAFVYLMRAAGVPARIVGGYLGGEANPFEDYLSVRQMDAHAWAEVWLDGKGWVRYDPTAQVAPERISRGVEAALMQREEFSPGGLLGFIGNERLHWLQDVRLWWDAVNYGWAHWFLNYNRERQFGWMKQWFGEGELGTLIRVLAVSLLAVILLLLVWMFRRLLFRRRGPAQLAARMFSRLLGVLGVHRQPKQTMVQYCDQVAQQYSELASTLTDFAAVYSALSYADLRYSWARRVRLHILVMKLAAQLIGMKIRRPSPRLARLREET